MVTFIILAVTVIFLIYKYSTRNYDYWKKRNVLHSKPLPFVGNFLDGFLLRSTLGHLLAKLYYQFDTPYFGMFVLNEPCLVIRSPELIKAVLVKDFNNFSDRNIASDEKADSIAAKMLFMSKNPEWKAIRNKITPIFTTGKIKTMLPLINKVADDMMEYLSKNSAVFSMEVKEVSAKYSTDVIASCAFGINAQCFENENAIFRVVGRKICDINWRAGLRYSMYFVAPGLVKLFKIPFLDQSVASFMRDVFWQTISERESNQLKRNDIIDVIIQIKNENQASDSFKFEGDAVVAQAGQFYLAGFETTSSTISYTLYQLAFSPKIQNRARAEAKDIIAKHGSLTYEALQDLKYLHMVICETLRMYPVLPFLDRYCADDYKLPDSDLILQKGTPVFIPLLGLHYDPVYFPEPMKYDPERFSNDNKHNLTNFSYLPFGDGPRSCIGERFGLTVAKLGLARILLNFEVERNSETPEPIHFDPKSFVLVSTVGLPLTFKKL